MKLPTIKLDKKSIASIVAGVTIISAGAFAVASPASPLVNHTADETTTSSVTTEESPAPAEGSESEPTTPPETTPPAEGGTGTGTTGQTGGTGTSGGTSQGPSTPTPPATPPTPPRTRVSEQLIYTDNGAGREIATCHVGYSDGTYEDIYRGARPSGDTSIQLEC